MVGWKLTTQNSLALKFQIARRLMTKEKKKKRLTDSRRGRTRFESHSAGFSTYAENQYRNFHLLKGKHSLLAISLMLGIWQTADMQ